MNVLRLSWLPVVEKGFCCCGLEMCCRILGYVSVVVHFLLIYFFYYLIGTVWGTDDDLKTATFCVCLIVAHVGGASSLLFIEGIRKGDHYKLLPFIMYLHIVLVCTIQGGIYFGLQYPVVSVLPTTLLVALVIYMLVCSNSLRLKMALSDGAKFELPRRVPDTLFTDKELAEKSMLEP